MHRRLGLEEIETGLRAFPVAALVGNRPTAKTALTKDVVREFEGEDRSPLLPGTSPIYASVEDLLTEDREELEASSNLDESGALAGRESRSGNRTPLEGRAVDVHSIFGEI